MGPHPPQRVRRTETSETGHFKIRGVGRKKLELVSYHNVIGNSVNSVSTVGSISSYKLSRQRTGSWRVPHALAARIVEVRASQAFGEVGSKWEVGHSARAPVSYVALLDSSPTPSSISTSS